MRDPQLKIGPFEIESVISVEDCDQTEILVGTFESSSGPGRLPGPDEVSNVPVLSCCCFQSESNPKSMPGMETEWKDSSRGGKAALRRSKNGEALQGGKNRSRGPSSSDEKCPGGHSSASLLSHLSPRPFV